MRYWDVEWLREQIGTIRIYEDDLRSWAGFEEDEEIEDDLITDYALEQIDEGCDWYTNDAYLGYVREGQEDD